MKKITIILGSIIGAIIILIIGFGIYKFNFTNDDIYLACTEEAKLCPDGTAVGRTGPDCSFPACPEITSQLTEAEAKVIAEKICIKGGEALGMGIYNSGTKTWWFDANLNSAREGCNPACVVNEINKSAEINWRCTGLRQ